MNYHMRAQKNRRKNTAIFSLFLFDELFGHFNIFVTYRVSATAVTRAGVNSEKSCRIAGQSEIGLHFLNSDERLMSVTALNHLYNKFDKEETDLFGIGLKVAPAKLVCNALELAEQIKSVKIEDESMFVAAAVAVFGKTEYTAKEGCKLL